MIDSILGLLAVLSLVSPANAAAPSATVLKALPIASQAPRVAPPKKRRPNSLGLETTSRSVFVADVATGSVLYAKKPHDVISIASLTKLMTAMVVLDQKRDPNEKIVFLEEDFEKEGKAVFAVGDVVTRREAFEALMVGSVNAAGNLLARTTLGKGEFVQAMNEKARTLRLASPIFVDPTGFDPSNRANAADVSAMLAIAMSYPEIRDVTHRPVVTVNASTKPYTIPSTNLLLGSFVNQKPYRIIGAKTGSLPQAGYSMAQITRDEAGHEIVVTTLASPNHFSRFQDVKAMTAWAFETFEW